MSPTRNDPQKFREQLRMATGRDLRAGQARRRRTRNFAIAGVTATALAASGVTVVAPWKEGPSLVERAEAALTPPPNVVVHSKTQTRSVEHGQVVLAGDVNEVWRQTSAITLRSRRLFQPGRIMSSGEIDPSGVPRWIESDLRFDPATRLAVERQFDPVTTVLVAGRPYDFGGVPEPEGRLTDIKHSLEGGLLTSSGSAEINGRSVNWLRGEYGPSDQHTVETYFLDSATLEPVRQELREFRGGGLQAVTTTEFLIYEELPATPENLRLTSITGAHPGVPVLDRDSVPFERRPGYLENAG